MVAILSMIAFGVLVWFWWKMRTVSTLPSPPHGVVRRSNEPAPPRSDLPRWLERQNGKQKPPKPSNSALGEELIWIGMVLCAVSFVTGSAMLPIVSGLTAFVSFPCLVVGIAARGKSRRRS